MTMCPSGGIEVTSGLDESTYDDNGIMTTIIFLFQRKLQMRNHPQSFSNISLHFPFDDL